MSIDDAFEAFWKAYPKKVGKLAARKAFFKLKPSLKAVLDALEWQKRSEQWLKDAGAFIPHPTTWLNQGRWEDEPPESIKPQVRQPEEACGVCRNNTGLVYSHKASGMVLANCKHGKAKSEARNSSNQMQGLMRIGFGNT